MTPTLRAAIQFFAEHACYCTPPGRMACAKSLAIAEQRAKEMGLTFVWEPECEPWDGEYPLAPTDLLEWVACYQRTEVCAHSDSGMCDRPKCARMLASLGMVATTGYSDPYRRVIEAELASEALDTLDAERDAIATQGANELAQRATFAGPGVES